MPGPFVITPAGVNPDADIDNAPRGPFRYNDGVDDWLYAVYSNPWQNWVIIRSNDGGATWSSVATPAGKFTTVGRRLTITIATARLGNVLYLCWGYASSGGAGPQYITQVVSAYDMAAEAWLPDSADGPNIEGEPHGPADPDFHTGDLYERFRHYVVARPELNDLVLTYVSGSNGLDGDYWWTTSYVTYDGASWGTPVVIASGARNYFPAGIVRGNGYTHCLMGSHTMQRLAPTDPLPPTPYELHHRSVSDLAVLGTLQTVDAGPANDADEDNLGIPIYRPASDEIVIPYPVNPLGADWTTQLKVARASSVADPAWSTATLATPPLYSETVPLGGTWEYFYCTPNTGSHLACALEGNATIFWEDSTLGDPRALFYSNVSAQLQLFAVVHHVDLDTSDERGQIYRTVWSGAAWSAWELIWQADVGRYAASPNGITGVVVIPPITALRPRIFYRKPFFPGGFMRRAA